MREGLFSRVKLSPKFLVIGVFIFICLMLLLYSNTVVVSQKPQLQAAKALWESQDIHDYRVVADVGIPLSFAGTYFITVRDSEIVEAGVRSAYWYLDPDSEYSQVEPVPLEQASKYTVEAVFEQAEAMVADEPFVELTTRCERHSLEFDNRYGYIKTLISDCSGGLFHSCVVGDCYFLIKVTEFQIISDGES